MKVLELTFAALILALSIWRLWALFKARRAAAREAARSLPTAPLAPLPPVLRDAGFTEPIETDDASGAARGIFDGVVMQAEARVETSPYSRLQLVTLSVFPRSSWQVSAQPQGMRRDPHAHRVGHAKADDYLEVTGNSDDARALFSGPGANALVDAIALWGWRLDDGQLLAENVGPPRLAPVIKAGVSAAKALVRP